MRARRIALGVALVVVAILMAVLHLVALLTYHNSAYPGSPASHGYVLSFGDNRPDSVEHCGIGWDSRTGVFLMEWGME